MSTTPTSTQLIPIAPLFPATPSSGLASVESLMDASDTLNVRAAQSQNVVVIGAGTQGISTAYFLGRAGHRVTVVDRSPASAGASFGSAASYTGLLQTSSGLAPFFARPHAFRAYKTQWCPYTKYMHPNLRVGLFDHEVGGRIRLGMIQWSYRPNFQDTLERMYGFSLYNNWILKRLITEWNEATPSTTTSQSSFWSRKSTPTPSPPLLPVVHSTVSLTCTDHAMKDLKYDLEMHHFLNDPSAKDPVYFTRRQPIISSPEAPNRLAELNDLKLVEQLPSLKPKEFKVSGGVLYQDEFAVDNLKVLQKMKQESIEKFGVKYLYDTEVTALRNQPPLTTNSTPASTALTTINSPAAPTGSVQFIETSQGPITADAFVICAGPDSKKLIRSSQFPSIQQPIPTFTTKTHHLSFPYPPIANETTSTTDAKKIATAVVPASSPVTTVTPVSIVMIESHTVITPFPNEIRVSTGDDINVADNTDISDADSSKTLNSFVSYAPQPVQVDPIKLKQLVDDVQFIYPDITREIISQHGATVPHVSLRTWTLDNKPLLGRYHSSIPNLFINNGHGNLGWTNALASGKLVADIVSGQKTFVDPEPFDPKRFFEKK